MDRQVAVQSVEPKASIMQKALRAVNIDGSVRIDENVNEASVIDVVKMLCPGVNSNNAAFMLARKGTRKRERTTWRGRRRLPNHVTCRARALHQD